MSLFIGHKPNPQHIQALVDCKLSSPALVDLFAAALEDVKDALVVSDDLSRTGKLQGQATVLRDFLEAVDAAPEIKQKMTS